MRLLPKPGPDLDHALRQIDRARAVLNTLPPAQATLALVVGSVAPDCPLPGFRRLARAALSWCTPDLVACLARSANASLASFAGYVERVGTLPDSGAAWTCACELCETYSAPLAARAHAAQILWWHDVWEGVVDDQLQDAGIDPAALREAKVSTAPTREQEALLRGWRGALIRSQAPSFARWLLASEVPALRAGPERRLVAVRLLHSLREAAAPAAPALIAQLESGDPRFLAEVAYSLGWLEWRASTAVPQLARLTQHPDALVRLGAEHSLTLLRNEPCVCVACAGAERDPGEPIPAPVPPQELRILIEPDPVSAEAAPLGDLPAGAELVVPMPAEAEGPAEVESATASADSTGTEPALELAEGDLIALLGSDDPEAVCEAAQALGAIGERAWRAGPALVALKQHPDERVRDQARCAWRRIVFAGCPCCSTA